MEMTDGIREIREEIERRTGIPSALLTGETREGIISQARQLLNFKKQCEQQQEQSGAGRLRDWFRECAGTAETGEDPLQAAAAALDEIESGPGYPIVQDAGEVDYSRLPDCRTPAEQFSEWFLKVSAWDPTGRGPREI